MKWIEDTAVAPKGAGKLIWVRLELASLESTKKCADAIIKMSEPIAVLMCMQRWYHDRATRGVS